MSISASRTTHVPILCIDTCSILDIMRDPTRDGVRVGDRQAVVDLLGLAEAGQLDCFIPEQVSIEFAAHEQGIQQDAAQKLAKARDTIERVNAIAAVYGVQAPLDLSHLDDHVTRSRAIVDRWLVQLHVIQPSAQAPMRAFARMNAGLPPAKRGKDSSKDCLIYETLLEHATLIRGVGTTVPLVFLSSNTTEYYTIGSVLKPEIAAEFAPLQIRYAPNMVAARYELGL